MNENSDLEQFRRQWRDEVNSRRKDTGPREDVKPQTSLFGVNQGQRQPDQTRSPLPRHPLADLLDEDPESENEKAESSLIKKIEGLEVRPVDDDDFSGRQSATEPESALDHYEKGVEMESQGSLGDSLSHYRKAYRMDAKVDQSYKKKHFPANSKPEDINPSNAAVTVPNPAHHSSKEPQKVLPFSEFIQTLSDAPITGAEPVINGDISPPCLIKTLPHEVLMELLEVSALIDPASFCRLALVCRKLAYHVHNEARIWKSVSIGPQYGLASQCYTFKTDIQGRELIDQTLDFESTKMDLFQFPNETDWREFFHNHPRIRYSGVYISTVNYTRPGNVTLGSSAWNSPVHIVTYYRYIRFFRDGTVISLLSTHKPIDVVHHLTHENVTLVRSSDKGHSTLLSTSLAPRDAPGAPNNPSNASNVPPLPPPTAQNIMRHALRGRWCLCPPTISTAKAASLPFGPVPGPTLSPTTTNTAATADPANQAGDVQIETEGAGPRYKYTMHLALRHGSRAKNATRNNKLVWKGFWSHNVLTDDWAEFQLRNDKAFWFSRVRSYGLGY